MRVGAIFICGIFLTTSVSLGWDNARPDIGTRGDGDTHGNRGWNGDFRGSHHCATESTQFCGDRLHRFVSQTPGQSRQWEREPRNWV